MSDSEASPQPFLDELMQFASREERKADLLEAKKEYFRLTGEVFEDDKQFEMRMASFLDWFLLDRPNSQSGRTPAQELYTQYVRNGPPEKASAFRNLTETVHGLFEVRKLGKAQIRLRDLFTGKDYDVTERRQLTGLEKGDLIEARLIPFGGLLLFSSAFCCHPKGSFKAILKEVKRRKKASPQAGPGDLIFECAKMCLKVDRYRQISVEKIYDFEKKALSI